MRFGSLENPASISHRRTSAGGWSTESKILGWFAVALTMIVVLGVAAYRNTTRIGDTADWVAHTNVVRTHLQRVRSLLAHAESAQRGYILTGNERYLELYRAADVPLRQALGSLHDLTSDYPELARPLEALDPLVAQRSALLERGIELRTNEGFEAALRHVMTEDGQRAMADVSRALDALDGRVGEALNRESRRAAEGVQESTATLVAAGFLVLCFVAAAIFVVLRDLTERRRAEAALRFSEERTRLLVESAHDAFVAIDANGLVIDWNHQAEQTFGWARAEAIGRSLAKTIIPPQHRSAHARGIKRFFATGEGPLLNVRTEITALHRDGREFPVELSVAPIRFGDSYIFSSFVHDISERRHAEERIRALNADLERRVEERTAELRRSNEELAQFASVASHDLQEPLRMVSSYTQLLARRYQGKLDATADEFIANAVDGAKHMQQLIRDLLSFSQVSTRGKPLAPSDCETILVRALTNLEVALQESGAQVTHDALPPVLGDPTQLTQVLQNLIGNAVKFRGAQPLRVHVGAERRDGEWVFSVRDNGIGMEEQYTDRIFVIFQRLHTREQYPGTGIGLAICKKIVERHGGRIWVHSAPGQGSTFYFTVPALRGAEAA